MRPRERRRSESLGVGENKIIALIFVFMVLTVLYYFLRFQFNQPDSIAVAQAATLALLGLFAIVGIVVGRFKVRNQLDFVFLLFLVHAVVFCSFIGIRDGIYDLGWAVLTSLLPILIYFYVSNVLSPAGAYRVLLSLEIIFLAVAIIYILEFLYLHVFLEGSFTYAALLNEHAIEKGSGGTSAAWVQGDLYAYYRLAGPLSHANTTGVALALGLVIVVARYASSLKISTTVPLIAVFSVALVLGGGRTAIASGAFGAMAAIAFAARISVSRMVIRLILIGVVVSSVLSWMIASEVIDISAFSKIYNIEQAADTIIESTTYGSVQAYLRQIGAFPFALLSGVGPPTLARSAVDDSYTILTDDFFAVSVLSQYGVVLPILFAMATWVTFSRAYRNARRQRDTLSQSLLAASLGCVITFLASTVHTNAAMRPQLFPIFAICLAIITVASRPRYQQLGKHESGNTLR